MRGARVVVQKIGGQETFAFTKKISESFPNRILFIRAVYFVTYFLKLNLMNGDATLHYNISDILLKTCDLNKIADFVDRADKLVSDFNENIGPSEEIFVRTVNEGIVCDQEKLLELKSKAWDEIFDFKQRNPMMQDWIGSSFSEFMNSQIFCEIKHQQEIINDWTHKRTIYKNMCLRVSDLLADYSYFLARDNHESPVQNSAIYIPGVIKLSSINMIYSDSVNCSVISIMDTLEKLKKQLLETLHNINRDIKHAKSISFDIVHESYDEKNLS